MNKQKSPTRAPEITQPSHRFAASFAGAGKPNKAPNIAGPMVTMASTAASPQSPTSAAATGAPAVWERVAPPRSAPGTTPTRSATIQRGESTG